MGFLKIINFDTLQFKQKNEGRMLSIPKNIYNSPDLPCDFLLNPSRRVHRSLQSNEPKTNFLKRLTLIVSEVAVQALLSPITAAGFLLKTTGIPFVLYHNEKKKNQVNFKTIQTNISISERYSEDNSSSINDNKETEETKTTFDGPFPKDLKKQDFIFKEVKKSFFDAINDASKKFVRVLNCSIIAKAETNEQTAEKTAKIGFIIGHHKYPDESEQVTAAFPQQTSPPTIEEDNPTSPPSSPPTNAQT